MENSFDILNKIKTVEAPTFLFTRIEQRIKNQEMQKLPLKWSVVSFASILMLVSLSVFALQKSSGSSQTAASYNLETTNYFYND